MTKNTLPVESTHVQNDALWLALFVWSFGWGVALIAVTVRALI